MPSRPVLQTPSYYEILRLSHSKDSEPLTRDDVKAAYHRALLIHHPDKATTRNASAEPIAPRRANDDDDDDDDDSDGSAYYSIDQIVAAYETLVDPSKRSAYDERLRRTSFSGGTSRSSKNEKGTHPGVEALDLEDLSYNEETNTWHHECRCGNEDGYVLNEADMEKEAERGEIYVGCKGCSLFIKVVFSVTEEVAVS
jgi:diphthamide biosynthesis protein 4